MKNYNLKQIRKDFDSIIDGIALELLSSPQIIEKALMLEKFLLIREKAIASSVQLLNKTEVSNAIYFA